MGLGLIKVTPRRKCSVGLLPQKIPNGQSNGELPCEENASVGLLPPRFCLVAAKLWQQVAAASCGRNASEIAASNKAQRQRHHSKTSTPASNTQH